MCNIKTDRIYCADEIIVERKITYTDGRSGWNNIINRDTIGIGKTNTIRNHQRQGRIYIDGVAETNSGICQVWFDNFSIFNKDEESI